MVIPEHAVNAIYCKPLKNGEKLLIIHTIKRYYHVLCAYGFYASWSQIQIKLLKYNYFYLPNRPCII